MKVISKFSYNNLFTNILGQKPYYYINLKLNDMYNIEEAIISSTCGFQLINLIGKVSDGCI